VEKQLTILTRNKMDPINRTVWLNRRFRYCNIKLDYWN